MQLTINEIVRASKVPLSVIIIGVVDEDFSLMDELDADEAIAITERIKAEPVTAAITIPFAAGMWMWELSWFIYPVVVYIYNRKFKHKSKS